MSKVLVIIIFAFSIFLALGEYKPLLPSIDIVPIISVFFFIALFNKKNRVIYFFYLKKMIPIFIIFFILIISQIFYDNVADFTINGLNFKFLYIIIWVPVLSTIFERYPNLIKYSLLIFSLTCLLLSIGVITGFINDAISISNGRVWLFGENPNSTSTRFVLSFLYFLYISLFSNVKNRKNKFFLFGLPFLLILILESGSRGSLLSLLMGSVTMVFLSDLKRFLKLIIIIIGLFLMFFSAVYLNDDFSIISRVQSSLDGESAGRDILWKHALDIWQENPIIGVGENGYYYEIFKLQSEYKDPHNLLLYLLATSGVIGFISFLYFNFFLIRKCFYDLKNRYLFNFILYLITFLIFIKTGGVLSYLIMWYIFSIILAKTNYEKNK